MTIDQELARVTPSRDTALTIGVFDGVHLGHQRLLSHLKKTAASGGLLSLAFTFRNHPRSVLNPDAKLGYITTVEERLELIRSQGIDQVVAVDFDRELSLLKASEFVSLLCERLRMKALVVGPDFALGHGREGDVATLRRLGTEMGFRVEQMEPYLMGDCVVRSRVTRDLIVGGDVENASRMLGRWYSLTGEVVVGDRRGRLLGFPTANLSVAPDLVIPADGIYATWATADGVRYQAATSIGVRPTFGTSHRTVEAYIMDFDRDLYGKPLTLEFAGRLRDEEAFESVDALVDQMKLDVEQARAILSVAPPVPGGDSPKGALRGR